MKVKCIKDVIMEDESVDFTEGKIYVAEYEDGELVAINDEKEEHTIKNSSEDGKKWFNEHFINVDEDDHEAYDRAMGML